MANVTSTSREALRTYFDQMAQRVRKTYGVDIWLAEIMGKVDPTSPARRREGILRFPPDGSS